MERQEDQGTLEQPEGSPLVLSLLPGPPDLPVGSSLGSLELRQTSLRKALHKGPSDNFYDWAEKDFKTVFIVLEFGGECC